MAKGQVSEEALTEGLKGIGNFGGLSSNRVRRDNPFRDSSSQPSVPTKTFEISKREVREHSNTQPVPDVNPEPIRPTMSPGRMEKTKAKKQTPMAAGRKADIYTERVTLQISPEMRDEVERIARELQRAKTSKEERITANTVIRVAIQLLTQNFSIKFGEVPNNEGELYHFAERALKR